MILLIVNKKLSYHKETARHLCKQYVEGIYSNSVTLKSALNVTETEPLGGSYTTYY